MTLPSAARAFRSVGLAHNTGQGDQLLHLEEPLVVDVDHHAVRPAGAQTAVRALT